MNSKYYFHQLSDRKSKLPVYDLFKKKALVCEDKGLQTIIKNLSFCYRLNRY